MGTYAEFIKKHRIHMRVEKVDSNPAFYASSGVHYDHWKLVLRCKGKQMTLRYSMGSGHKGKAPELADVLEVLAMEAAGIEAATDFHDWARDLGFPFSAKARRSYDASVRNTAKLKNLLGEEAYDELLYDTEDL